MPAFFFHLVFDLEPKQQLQHQSFAPEAKTSFEARTNRNGEANWTEGSGSSKPLAFLPSRDWRYNLISFQTISMTSASARSKHESKAEELGGITNGINDGPRGLATKGRFEPAEPQDKKLGWGVVRLYRDTQETPRLYDEPLPSSHGKHAKASRSAAAPSRTDHERFRDEECTTLCILAVPSYLTPSDFLGFVGEKTRDEVSHFRMIRTEKSNRYMVLMRFRSGKKAREWRREWNGKGFDGMEPENCHVVFVKSISFSNPPDQPDADDSSFPDMRNDPFTPLSTNTIPSSAISSSTATAAATRSTKPIPPPTPALIELPTCPVCLERMDESTGLLTILCQHVFHCSCLQKWRGSGCPVCRYTQSPNSKYHTPRPLSHQEAAAATGPLNECVVCHSESNLWICLICGNTGCGRYDAAHAFQHYEETGHCFAMDMGTQRVWDYAGDGYVHRILQDKTDGKFLECEPDEDDSPHNAFDSESRYGDDSVRDDQAAQGGGTDEGGDTVPRTKLDKLSHEYTSLLTSQLDSQRQYFHRMIAQAADKSHHLQLSNQESALSLSSLQSQLDGLQAAHQTLLTTTLPDLEKEKNRAETKAKRFEDMARRLEREWRDEKAMNSGLVEKVARLETEIGGLREERRELAEVVRDLQFFVSGAQKVRDMGAEIEGGDVGLPPPLVERKRVEDGETGKGGGNNKGKKQKGGGGGKK